MQADDFISQLPSSIVESPYLQEIFNFIRFQAQTIQAQAQKIQAQAEEIAKLSATVDDLKDEIDRLKKTPKRPKFRANNLESRNRSGKGKNDPLSNKSNTERSIPPKACTEIRVEAANVPKGSRFKGYQDFSLQEVDVIASDVTYRLEVWQAPDGKVIRATLPEEIQGQHFGPALRALMINLYSNGMTQPALLDFLYGLGISISTGQISHILLNEAEALAQVSEEILTAGLQEAPYIRVDDTGEKHLHKNSYCTHIGGEHFAYYKTSSSKSRMNFLKLLLQGKDEGFYINEAMIWHLFQCGVEDDILNCFEKYKGKRYSSRRGLSRLLNVEGFSGKKLRGQCIEAGLVGFISETVLRPGQVLLSDRAGQFAVFDHAACWIHMERPLRKISTKSEQVENEIKEVRGAIWTLYRALKEAALNQTEIGLSKIHQLYDQLVQMKSISPKITEVIDSFRKYRCEMLKVLEHPRLPLHNNDSERDLRGVAKRRKLSGSTKSDLGRKFRDGLMSVKQTCFRLGYSFWEFTTLWFKRKSPDLTAMIRQNYQLSLS